MGALIQTKGTQFLAQFFTDRFSGANLATLRGITDLVDSFGSGNSLFDISEAYLNQWSDGSDVLYPTATVKTTVAAAANTDVLTFAILPAYVVDGRAVEDDSNRKAIQPKTTVTRLSSTQVKLSLPLKLAVGSGDVIVFSDANHPNLWKRWKHYLKKDLLDENHSKIQSAIYDALLDQSYKNMSFQAIEADEQRVLHGGEFLSVGGRLDPATKYKQIILLTSRTTAPDKIDRQ